MAASKAPEPMRKVAMAEEGRKIEIGATESRPDLSSTLMNVLKASPPDGLRLDRTGKISVLKKWSP